MVKYIISEYCKTNYNLLKSIYIKRQFINSFVNVTTAHLFTLPIAVYHIAGKLAVIMVDKSEWIRSGQK